jgi:ornithine--oxo-acid transaminase
MTTLTRSGQKPGQPAFAVPAASADRTAAEYVRRERAYGSRNYDPLPVVISQGEGSWLTDVEGRRYLDLMSAYSAVSFGHAHPKIVAALTEQAHRLAVTSRAYFNDRLPLLLERLVAMTGLDRALPVNTGSRPVETAVKASRKWAYKVKGVPEGRAEIIGCKGNFHGRSITATGLSTEPQYRDGFGPYPSGLTTIRFDDVRRARGRDHAEHCCISRRTRAGRGRASSCRATATSRAAPRSAAATACC